MRIPYRIRQLVDRSYTASSIRSRIRYYVDPAYRRDPLIVYQMGKVGSEALEASLLTCGLKRPLYRVHAMVASNILEGLAQAQTSPREYFRRSTTDFQGFHLGREIARDLYKHQWQVITMVRDPVAQNVSSFFQILDLLMPDFDRRLAADEIEIGELMALFVAHYPPDNVFLRWFDVELGAVFDIDVFAHPFPVEAGFGRITLPHIDLLILRLEDFDRVASPAVGEFLGLSGFTLLAKNVASQKRYHRLYERFKAEAVFPAAYVEGVYGSRYAQHFYSESERSLFRSRLRVA